VGVVDLLTLETDVLPASPMGDVESCGVAVRFCLRDNCIELHTTCGRASTKAFPTKAEAHRWVNDAWATLSLLGVAA